MQDAGRGMRDEAENAGGIQDDNNVMAGYVITILRRKQQDLLILSGSMRDKRNEKHSIRRIRHAENCGHNE